MDGTDYKIYIRLVSKSADTITNGMLSEVNYSCQINKTFITLTLSLPMSPICDQRQSANVALMRLVHVVCFSDVYYPILRHIVANKGDNLNIRPVFGKQTRKWQKKS